MFGKSRKAVIKENMDLLQATLKENVRLRLKIERLENNKDLLQTNLEESEIDTIRLKCKVKELEKALYETEPPEKMLDRTIEAHLRNGQALIQVDVEYREDLVGTPISWQVETRVRLLGD